ncbi:MAG: hypothetical protein IPM63_02690 [Acidobacteriota bacterium]|nr:MAG: hypothetical protein IPM63_02690 [Acidobacteriota bacterium]
MDIAVKRSSFLARALACGLFAFLCSVGAFAQSNDPNFPTPVVGNEVSGTIQARAIGDPRLTTYYFIFNGNRGDVFINIYTTNFKGEIDIYTAQGLDPRTKITIYADNPERETARVVYQRQTERLILRIQGRTPNDDPATYQIKFAGSFAPITGAEAENMNEFPDILSDPSGGVKVSPTGEIIPEEKKEIPAAVSEQPAEAIADDEEIVAEDVEDDSPPTVDPPAEPEKKADQPVAADAPATERLENPRVIVTDPLEDREDKPREVTVDLTGDAKKEEVSAVVTVERIPVDEDEAAADDEEKTDPAADEDQPVADPSDVPEAAKPDEEKAPAAEESNPLARVLLKVELKDGTKIERRMTEVVSVNVVNGMLTIVTSDGLTRQIPILDVLKMTIGP